MKIMKVLTIGVTVGGIALAMNSEKVNAAEWTPRTAEQIKAEIKGNEYTIVWGDTLSAISQATNITVQKLADMNKITNVDLIYAGNKLSFDGNVASVQNSAGETVAQTVIQDTDKVNPSQPVGQPAQGATTNNEVVDNTQTGNQVVGNAETTPSAPEQTPVQPDNNVNQGEQTTPSTPENNGNTGENQPSNPGNGGTTTPEQPNQPGGGNTDNPSTPSNEYDPMTPVGSGGLFGSAAEATAAGQAEALELKLEGKGDYRVVVWEVKYTDGRNAGWTYELAV